MLSILSSREHGTQGRRIISKSTSNGDWEFSGEERKPSYPPTGRRLKQQKLPYSSFSRAWVLGPLGSSRVLGACFPAWRL